MTTLLIYGASDDLVEVEGDLRAETYSPNGPVSIVVNNLILGHLLYSTDGCWHFSPHPTFTEDTDEFTITVTSAIGENSYPHPETDIPGYSDFLTIHGLVTTIQVGNDPTIVLL